ncbi:MAG TPA: kelch repeat-containing protein [Planctomycetota bacterium]|nr:kelch repeat-containing protein [Planctomycetota bacterium]
MHAVQPSAAWPFVALLMTLFGATQARLGKQAPLSPPRDTVTLEWKSEPDSIHARSAHAIVSTGSAIFVVGGTGSSDSAVEARAILEVERFDGKKWSLETKLPGEGLNAPAAVIFERRLWVIGGFGTTSNVPVADVRVYDLEKRTWSDAPPLPAARGGHAAIVFGGKIHVLGGGNSVSTLADHCAFDPSKRAWEERAPLSRSKGSPAAVEFEGKLWAIGGRSGQSDFGETECYDDATDRWTPGPAIEARATVGAVVWRDAIWIIGGESQARSCCLASVQRFDPATRKWQESTALPTARNYARAALLGDTLVVVGGSKTAGSSHASVGSNIVESAR